MKNENLVWYSTEECMPSESGAYYTKDKLTDNSYETNYFSTCLEDVDRYNFHENKGGGFCAFDIEYGFYLLKPRYWAYIPTANERQNNFVWHDADKELPINTDCEYLVASLGYIGLSNKHEYCYFVCSFSKCLSEVDDYNFPAENHCGFYYLDWEYGHTAVEGVKYWAEINKPCEEDMKHEK